MLHYKSSLYLFSVFLLMMNDNSQKIHNYNICAWEQNSVYFFLKVYF